MNGQPEIPPPDTINPHSPPEIPPLSSPNETPHRESPEVIPETPDVDEPGKRPSELPAGD